MSTTLLKISQNSKYKILMALIKATLKNHYYTIYQLSFITPVPKDLAMQAHAAGVTKRKKDVQGSM